MLTLAVEVMARRKAVFQVKYFNEAELMGSNGAPLPRAERTMCKLHKGTTGLTGG